MLEPKGSRARAAPLGDDPAVRAHVIAEHAVGLLRRIALATSPGRAYRERRRRRRFNEAIVAAEKPIRIHVGAGSQRIRGWIDTDVRDTGSIYLDATRRWPLESGTVDYVYGDNFIEHLTLEGARIFLTEVRRVMRKGGRLRLVTPDVAANARLYLAGGDEQRRLMDRHRRSGYRVDYAADILWVTYAESEHWRGYLYDEHSLTAELRRAGFSVFTRHRPGESLDPMLIGIDSRTEPGDELHQMIIEAS